MEEKRRMKQKRALKKQILLSGLIGGFVIAWGVVFAHGVAQSMSTSMPVWGMRALVAAIFLFVALPLVITTRRTPNRRAYKNKRGELNNENGIILGGIRRSR